MKIRPVGAEFSHADGRTNRQDEANSRFSQSCERAQKGYILITENLQRIGKLKNKWFT